MKEKTPWSILLFWVNFENHVTAVIQWKPFLKTVIPFSFLHGYDQQLSIARSQLVFMHKDNFPLLGLSLEFPNSC